jgi:hypothetical protein
MDAATLDAPVPAVLFRRMTTTDHSGIQIISRNSSAPLLRFAVEAVRGSLKVQLDTAPEEGSIQWTQNGVPIVGQTGPSLHLASLAPEDGDVYYALLRSASGEIRSQSFLVVVVPGYPLLNFSARAWVSPTQPLIGGFVVGRVPGPIKKKHYLIRAIGGSLQKFGVANPVAHADLTLHRGKVKQPDPVQDEKHAALVREWEQKVGAFVLEPGAADKVAIVELSPGPYSFVVTGGPAESGEALLEIYEISL